MIITLRSQLTAFLLLVALLLAPLTAFAAEVTAGATQGTCACQLLHADSSAAEGGDLTDHQQGNNTDDCCDSEESSADGAEPQLVGDLKLNILTRQLSHQKTNGLIPNVYLTIFVPPENCLRA